MTDCPAYLSITINDRSEAEEVFKHDLLISCPPFFNLTYTLPTQGLRHDKAIDVIFFDSKREYRVFLSYLFADGGQRSPAGSNLVGEDTSDETGSEQPRFEFREGLCFFVFAVILSLVVNCLAFLVSLFLDLSPFPFNATRDLGTMTSSRRRSVIVVVYVIARVVVALTFTFGALFLLLALFLRRPIDDVIDGTGPEMLRRPDFSGMVRFDDPEEEEEEAKASGSVQIACSNYVDEMVAVVLSRMDEHVTRSRFGDDDSVSGAVRDVLGRNLRRHGNRWGVAWQQQVRAVKNQVRLLMRRHRSRIAASLGSRWFQFARSLYNATLEGNTNDDSRGSDDDHDDVDYDDGGIDLDFDLRDILDGTNDTWNFLEFLQISNEAEKNYDVLKNFLER